MSIAAVQKVHEAKKRAKKRGDEQRIKELAKAFNKYDKNKSGDLTREDVASAIYEFCGTSPEGKELDFIMKVSDKKPPEGHLGLKEFGDAISSWQCYLQEMKEGGDLAVLFDDCDADHTGALTQEQLHVLLEKYSGAAVSDATVDKVLRQADMIGDGQIHKIELKLALAYWFQTYAQELFAADAQQQAESQAAPDGGTAAAAAAGAAAPTDPQMSSCCAIS